MDTYNFWRDLTSGRIASMIKETSFGKSLTNSTETVNVIRPFFAEEDDVEKMYGIFLNQKNLIISIEMLSKGTIAAATVYPREIIKKTLELKAAAIILAHNHPSGNPDPSQEDLFITKRLMIPMLCIDVAIHDHIIIGSSTSYVSLADKGIIEKIRNEIKQIT